MSFDIDAGNMHRHLMPRELAQTCKDYANGRRLHTNAPHEVELWDMAAFHLYRQAEYIEELEQENVDLENQIGELEEALEEEE